MLIFKPILNQNVEPWTSNECPCELAPSTAVCHPSCRRTRIPTTDTDS